MLAAHPFSSSSQSSGYERDTKKVTKVTVIKHDGLSPPVIATVDWVMVKVLVFFYAYWHWMVTDGSEFLQLYQQTILV